MLLNTSSVMILGSLGASGQYTPRCPSQGWSDCGWGSGALSCPKPSWASLFVQIFCAGVKPLLVSGLLPWYQCGLCYNSFHLMLWCVKSSSSKKLSVPLIKNSRSSRTSRTRPPWTTRAPLCQSGFTRFAFPLVRLCWAGHSVTFRQQFFYNL